MTEGSGPSVLSEEKIFEIHSQTTNHTSNKRGQSKDHSTKVWLNFALWFKGN